MCDLCHNVQANPSLMYLNTTIYSFHLGQVSQNCLSYLVVKTSIYSKDHKYKQEQLETIA